MKPPLFAILQTRAQLNKNVEVTMGETLLLGGERCNHFVQIPEVY